MKLGRVGSNREGSVGNACYAPLSGCSVTTVRILQPYCVKCVVYIAFQRK